MAQKPTYRKWMRSAMIAPEKMQYSVFVGEVVHGRTDDVRCALTTEHKDAADRYFDWLTREDIEIIIGKVTREEEV
jgi:hypothetical protein